MLVQEAEMFGKTSLSRAVGVRNGLLLALLALHPIRIKNLAALAIGRTFLNVAGRWWLHIPAENTKSRRMDERQVPEFITVSSIATWKFTVLSCAVASNIRPYGSLQQPVNA
jgi:hypothetical protein